MVRKDTLGRYIWIETQLMKYWPCEQHGESILIGEHILPEVPEA
jgi:hypothetical protein